MDVVVNPPKPGDASYESFIAEYNAVFNSLKDKAEMVSKEMNSWKGMSCVKPVGAMYVFPRILIPEKGV